MCTIIIITTVLYSALQGSAPSETSVKQFGLKARDQ